MVWRLLKKLAIKPPYDPAIPLLGIYPEETKVEKDTCIPLFVAALFTIARTWKQPRCPSTDEWIKKLWYINTMEYYSAIKRNAFESVLKRWMNLEPITVDQGAPLGPVSFAGPKWRDLFKHVVSEAHRLGLEVNMNNDAGWCGSGGPWITPELSMQRVVWAETNITGPTRFE